MTEICAEHKQAVVVQERFSVHYIDMVSSVLRFVNFADNSVLNLCGAFGNSQYWLYLPDTSLNLYTNWLSNSCSFVL